MSADQSTLQVVGPAVIRALNAAGKDAALHVAEPCAAMPADVVKGARPTGAIADEENARAGDVAPLEGAAGGNLIEAAAREPHAREDAFHLRCVPRRLGVIAGGQGLTLGHRSEGLRVLP